MRHRKHKSAIWEKSRLIASNSGEVRCQQALYPESPTVGGSVFREGEVGVDEELDTAMGRDFLISGKPAAPVPRSGDRSGSPLRFPRFGDPLDTGDAHRLPSGVSHSA